MKPGGILSLLGVWLLVMATMRYPWPARLLCLQSGLSLLAVGVAYFRRRPDVWGKQADGRIPDRRLFALWPMQLLNHATFHLMRWLTESDAMNEIIPRLHLGRRLVGQEAALANPVSFEAVLDLTSEFTEPPALRATEHYLCLPVLDHAAPTQAQLTGGVAFIRGHRPNGPVFVHCAAGHGRSATVVAAYLLAERLQPDPEAAVRRIQQSRPGVRLSEEQRHALNLFMEQLGPAPDQAG